MTEPGSVTHRSGGNFLRLLKGRGVAALLSLAALAIMTRSLSPQQFGLLMLLNSLVLSLRSVCDTKPFEAIVFYGKRHARRPDVLCQLFRITLLVDVVTAGLAFTVGWLTIGVIGHGLGWSPEALQVARLYMLVLLFTVTGTASGVLRLYDRFDLIAHQRAIAGMVMLIGAAAVALGGGGLALFALVQALAFVAERLWQQAHGWREYRRHHPAGMLRGPLRARQRRRFPGLWRFLAATYWQGNLDLFPKHLTVLAAGALLGEAAAGLYRLAGQTARTLSVPALLARQVLFPDLAELWRSNRLHFAALIRRALALAAALAVFFVALTVLAGQPILIGLFGSEYAAAHGVMIGLMLAASMGLPTSVLRAGAYARGHAGRVLAAAAVGVALHAALFVPLGRQFGLGGTGIAAAAGALLTLSLLARSGVRDRTAPGPGPVSRRPAPVSAGSARRENGSNDRDS